MAEFIRKPGTFTIFKNHNKVEGSNQPDYKGIGKDMQGNDIEMPIWINRNDDGSLKLDSNGNPMQNGKIQKPYEKNEQPVQKESTQSNAKVDDLPF